ncbi:hypothetical protein C1H46_013958 [Malus baccata]|uniref:Uncharacterized protein n=1 Tax=Malus baccata TaxID=106549 RepID=A0A540MPY9_MALBA|nr:hypothetical protein C1H46_013958 [Malus baccata]
MASLFLAASKLGRSLLAVNRQLHFSHLLPLLFSPPLLKHIAAAALENTKRKAL